MGDYDSGSYHMKGNESVICKKFRRIFINAVQNMLNIVKSIFDTGLRPELFCRSVF